MKRMILFLAFFIAAGGATFAGKKYDKEVVKAFELRLAGKTDEAKLKLDAILAEDSTVAMAWYELARLNQYKMIGGGGTNMEDILVPISKAVKLEPENPVYAYFQAVAGFLNAYISMESGQEGEMKDRIAETCKMFERVISLKPDYCEPMLYLVDIYGMLPKDMGGDSVKALYYADKLAGINGYFGAKAKAALTPEGTDMVKYWEDLIAAGNRKPDFLAEAGKACLFADDSVKAEKYFNEAIKSDPSKNILILDLGRYHMMMVMQNQEIANTELPLAKIYLEKYLSTEPLPIVPLKAYAMGLLARVEMFMGNKAEGDKLVEEAKSLDPYFSRALGVPTLLLFDPPDQLTHHYFSFFSPF